MKKVKGIINIEELKNKIAYGTYTIRSEFVDIFSKERNIRLNYKIENGHIELRLKDDTIFAVLELQQDEIGIYGLLGGLRIDVPSTSIYMIKEKDRNILMELKRGDWFYIKNNGSLMIYKFEGIDEKSRIVGINPADGSIHIISTSYEVGLVGDLIKK